MHPLTTALARAAEAVHRAHNAQPSDYTLAPPSEELTPMTDTGPPPVDADRLWTLETALRRVREAIAIDETPSRLEIWPVSRILHDLTPGTSGRSWDNELAWLADNDPERIDALEADMRTNGVTSTLTIGPDGRLWRGHHRLAAAVRAGIPYLPVRLLDRAPDVLPCEAHAHLIWQAWHHKVPPEGPEVHAWWQTRLQSMGYALRACNEPSEDSSNEPDGLREQYAAAIRAKVDGTEGCANEHRLADGAWSSIVERDEARHRAKTAEHRLHLVHQARRAKEHQLDDIRRALCDTGLMEDDDPYSHADLADVIRQTSNTDTDQPEPNPPGSTREQLPDHLLALIRPELPNYLSTACSTGQVLAATIPNHPDHATELDTWLHRMHQRCRLNMKFTGQLCCCECHTEKEPTP